MLEFISKFRNKRLRDQVAEKVRKLRKGEQENKLFYMKWRDMEQYETMLRGFDYLFEYARKLEHKTVLEIGGGETRALAEIAKSEVGKGLKFMATVLTRDKKIEDNLGFENVKITTVEELRGIGDKSISCIIAVYSLPYVVSAELAVKSMDRVLEEGGVCKLYLTNYSSTNKKRKDGKSVIDGEFFVKEFIKLSYDVSEISNYGDMTLIAIKPGGKKTATAAEIGNKDLEIMRNKIESKNFI